MGAKAKERAKKASVAGVTGGAGDLVQFGNGRPVVAEGLYCSLDRGPLTPDRQAKGDLVWGDWTVSRKVVIDPHTGELRVQHEKVQAWRRADRLTTLFRSRTITAAMHRAGSQLAATAEAAGKVGLASTFGTMKLSGGMGSLLPCDGGMAAQRLDEAMAMLGGSSSLMGGTVWLVAVCGVSLNALEGGAAWDGRRVAREQALGVLQAGLDILAIGYGYVQAKAA